MASSIFGSAVVAMGLTAALCVACGGSSNDGGSGGAGGGGNSAGRGNSAGNATGDAGSSSGDVAGSGNTAGRSNNGSGFETSVPGNKTLDTLTDSEVQQLCGDVAEYAGGSLTDGLQGLSCRTTGLLAAVTSGAETDASARAACKAAYDGCIAQPPDTDFSDCEKPPANCKATVSELGACMNAYPAFLDSTLPKVPKCEDIEVAKIESYFAALEGLETPAACETYEAKCPGDSMMNGTR